MAKNDQKFDIFDTFFHFFIDEVPTRLSHLDTVYEIIILFIHSFIQSFIHLFIHSFIHSFIEQNELSTVTSYPR